MLIISGFNNESRIIAKGLLFMGCGVTNSSKAAVDYEFRIILAAGTWLIKTNPAHPP